MRVSVGMIPLAIKVRHMLLTPFLVLHNMVTRTVITMSMTGAAAAVFVPSCTVNVGIAAGQRSCSSSRCGYWNGSSRCGYWNGSSRCGYWNGGSRSGDWNGGSRCGDWNSGSRSGYWNGGSCSGYWNGGSCCGDWNSRSSRCGDTCGGTKGSQICSYTSYIIHTAILNIHTIN